MRKEEKRELKANACDYSLLPLRILCVFVSLRLIISKNCRQIPRRLCHRGFIACVRDSRNHARHLRASFACGRYIFACYATDRRHGQRRSLYDFAESFKANRGASIEFGLRAENGAGADVIGTATEGGQRFFDRTARGADNSMGAQNAARIGDRQIIRP
jgi:hypothetical protein